MENRTKRSTKYDVEKQDQVNKRPRRGSESALPSTIGASISKRARHRPNIFSRGLHTRLNEDNINEIYETTQNYHCFKFKGTVTKGLEKYTDSTPYGITEESEQRFLRAEIERLVNAANSTGDLLLNTNGKLTSSLETSLTEIRDLADQVRCALHVIIVDNAATSFKHCTNDIKRTTADHRMSHRELKGRFGNDWTGVQGSMPKKLLPEDRNERLFHLLVDFITASIARLLARVATSKYWTRQAFSGLAACAVKLKVLARNLEVNADLCISTAEDALEETLKSLEQKQTLIIKLKPGGKDDLQDMDVIDMETSASAIYHEEKALLVRNITALIDIVLGELLGSREEGADAACFQVFSTIYKAGIDGFATTVYNHRAGEVSASSRDIELKVAYTAGDLVIRNAKVIDKKKDGQESLDNATAIFCQWEHTDSDWNGYIQTTSADDIFSLLIPLSLCSPSAAGEVIGLLSYAVSATNEDDPVREVELPPEHVHATFTITSSDWQQKERLLSSPKYHDPWVQTLPQSPIRPGIRAGTNTFAMPTSHTSTRNSVPGKVTREKSAEDKAEQLRKYQRKRSEMRTWRVDEDTISVSCHRYVYLIVSLAVVIVCGGIAVPFAVGKRFTGVDPFQITLFSWLIAGFILLVAKGRYVNEWPWHEFFHGHVICRSVSELSDVTRIDPQTIILYLLLNEWRSILTVRGPYNGMFQNTRENGTGFSIDEPVHLSTMMGSGFIPLKVLNWHGEHLICLDARKATETVWMRLQQKHLVCWRLADYEELDPEDMGSLSDVQVKEDYKVKRLRTLDLRTERVLGVYIEPCYFG